MKDGTPSADSKLAETLRTRHRRPAPTLSTSTTALDLADRRLSDATFDVWNSGANTLDYTLSVDPGNGPAGWIAVTPPSGSSNGEHHAADVSIRRDILGPGAYTGLVHVDTGTQRVDVRVSAQIAGVQTSATAIPFGYGSGPTALDVWNAGAGDLSFHVSSQPAWLGVDRSSGMSSTSLDHQTLQLTIDRSGLADGHYDGALQIDPDVDQGSHSATVDVSMDVGQQGGLLVVTPGDDYQGAGNVGGPFTPAGIDYLLSNGGDADLDWTASSSVPWMQMSATGGTLAPGASTTVTASINPFASLLPAGAWHADLAFANGSNGRGDAARRADLVVNDPGLSAVIYAAPNPMKIAPYTALFSGIGSSSNAAAIVRWNWDFGDSGDGNPQTDEEMLVVHRFDHPGSYTVKLTVTDALGSTNVTATTVDVTEFTGRTFYVSSSSGSDAGDGSSAHPWRTLAYAFGRMANNQQSQPDRLLLRCGDTWSQPAEIDPPRPCLLDSYGSGDRPTIEFTAPDTGLGWYGGSGGTPDDWGYAPVLSNLHLRYATKNGSGWLVNAYLRGSTFRNCTIENGSIIASLQSEGLVVEGCDVSYGRKLGVYSSGSTVVLRHSTFTGSGSDATYDHQVYLNNGSRWLLEDCVFDGAKTGLNNNAAKLNGGQGVVVRRCEARGSRNGFDAGRNLEESSLPVADNYLFDECVSHDNGSGGQAAGLFISWIGTVTVRNSVFYNHDPTGGGEGAIWMWKSNAAVNHVNLYNNVFYSNNLPDIYIETANYDVVLRNNVFSRDVSGSSGGFLRLEAAGSSLPMIDSDHNVFWWTAKSSADSSFGMSSGTANLSFDAWRSAEGKDANSRYGNPLFTDPAHLDFTLQTGSPAIDAGQTVALVSRDKLWVARPKGTADDAGVYER